MRNVIIKVCGLQEEEHMIAAAAAGVDYVGLVFARSRRQVTPVQATRLVRSLEGTRGRPLVVGVFVNESSHTVNSLVEQCGLDMVQLSGGENAEFCATVATPIIRSIPVYKRTTGYEVMRKVNDIRSFDSVKEVFFLLDTGTATGHGGSGRSFDWRVAEYVSRYTPALVGGGLNSANVGQLVRTVRPLGVDVSSGVELDGRKNATLIHAFVHAVRKVQQELEDECDLHATR